MFLAEALVELERVPPQQVTAKLEFQAASTKFPVGSARVEDADVFRRVALLLVREHYRVIWKADRPRRILVQWGRTAVKPSVIDEAGSPASLDVLDAPEASRSPAPSPGTAVAGGTSSPWMDVGCATSSGASAPAPSGLSELAKLIEKNKKNNFNFYFLFFLQKSCKVATRKKKKSKNSFSRKNKKK